MLLHISCYMQTNAVLALFELFFKEEHLWHMQISDAGHV